MRKKCDDERPVRFGKGQKRKAEKEYLKNLKTARRRIQRAQKYEIKQELERAKNVNRKAKLRILKQLRTE